MTTKSTTVKKEVTKKAVVAVPVREKIVNESRLVLPQDIGGFTSNFRREAARSVGRIMNDPKKLEIFQELLAAFGVYAEDRFEHSLVVHSKNVADKAAKLRLAEVDALNTAEGIIRGKRAHAEKLLAEIAVHDTKMEAIK
jgi:hypothetical protein